MNNISWISFYKLIMSQNSYKETYKELTKRLQCATSRVDRIPVEHLQGVKVTLNYRADLSYTEIGRWNNEESYTFNMYGRTHISTIGHHKKGNPDMECSKIKIIVKKIFKYFLKTLYSKFIEEIQYQAITNVTQISVGNSKYDTIEFSIEDGLTAWDWEYVFIWHTEQECGEGWLFAQRDPEILEEQTTLSIW